MTQTLKGYISLIAADIIFGFSFLFSKVALSYSDPICLVALRFAVAFTIMNILLLSGMFKLNLKGKPLFSLFLCGFIQPVMYFLCETYGIKMTSSSFAGVMIGLLPIFGLISGAVFLKERITAMQVICVLLSVFGVYLTTAGGEVSFSMIGFLLLIGAVASGAAYSTLSASLAENFSAFERTYIMFLIGFVSFSIMALFSTGFNIPMILKPLSSRSFLIALFFLGFVSSVLAFFCTNYGLNYIPVSTQTILANLTTVISILNGMIFLQERFTLVQGAGILLILISVFVITTQKKMKTRKL